jgi:hypothetical protein
MRRVNGLYMVRHGPDRHVDRPLFLSRRGMPIPSDLSDFP